MATLHEMMSSALLDAKKANADFPWSAVLDEFCAEIQGFALPGARAWWTMKAAQGRDSSEAEVTLHAMVGPHEAAWPILAHTPGSHVRTRAFRESLERHDLPHGFSLMVDEACLPLPADPEDVAAALANILRMPEFHARFGFLGLAADRG